MDINVVILAGHVERVSENERLEPFSNVCASLARLRHGPRFSIGGSGVDAPVGQPDGLTLAPSRQCVREDGGGGPAAAGIRGVRSCSSWRADRWVPGLPRCIIRGFVLDEQRAWDRRLVGIFHSRIDKPGA